jgi:DNA-binding MarR family transcriptional regulator
LVRIEVGNVDQRERVAHLTAAGEAAIEAALPYWRKAQKRIAALVEPSAIGELAHRLDVAGAREQIQRGKEQEDQGSATHPGQSKGSERGLSCSS